MTGAQGSKTIFFVGVNLLCGPFRQPVYRVIHDHLLLEWTIVICCSFDAPNVTSYRYYTNIKLKWDFIQYKEQWEFVKKIVKMTGIMH